MKTCYDCPSCFVSDGECDQSVWCEETHERMGWVGHDGYKGKIPENCPLPKSVDKDTRFLKITDNGVSRSASLMFLRKCNENMEDLALLTALYRSPGLTTHNSEYGDIGHKKVEKCTYCLHTREHGCQCGAYRYE